MSDEIVEEVNLFDEGNDKPETKAVEDEQPAKEEPSFEVPEKFKGKSFEDVVEAYTNLEKESGRKANEVGELRKLTDEILKQQLEATPPMQEVKEVGFDDLIDNPSKAIDSALENNPRLKALEESLQRDQAVKAQEALRAKHSDVDSVISSPDFAAWVQKSPSRARLFQEANQNYDAALGIELLDMYKATSGLSADQARAERDAKAAADKRKAAVESGGNSAEVVKKVFRRAELIRLKIENPSKYAAMADEIRQAYAEGRVK